MPVCLSVRALTARFHLEATQQLNNLISYNLSYLPWYVCLPANLNNDDNDNHDNNEDNDKDNHK